jgi:hypothetical protein
MGKVDGKGLQMVTSTPPSSIASWKIVHKITKGTDQWKAVKEAFDFISSSERKWWRDFRIKGFFDFTKGELAADGKQFGSCLLSIARAAKGRSGTVHIDLSPKFRVFSDIPDDLFGLPASAKFTPLQQALPLNQIQLSRSAIPVVIISNDDSRSSRFQAAEVPEHKRPSRRRKNAAAPAAAAPVQAPGAVSAAAAVLAVAPAAVIAIAPAAAVAPAPAPVAVSSSIMAAAPSASSTSSASSSSSSSSAPDEDSGDSDEELPRNQQPRAPNRKSAAAKRAATQQREDMAEEDEMEEKTAQPPIKTRLGRVSRARVDAPSTRSRPLASLPSDSDDGLTPLQRIDNDQSLHRQGPYQDRELVCPICNLSQIGTKAGFPRHHYQMHKTARLSSANEVHMDVKFCNVCGKYIHASRREAHDKNCG